MRRAVFCFCCFELKSSGAWWPNITEFFILLKTLFIFCGGELSLLVFPCFHWFPFSQMWGDFEKDIHVNVVKYYVLILRVRTALVSLSIGRDIKTKVWSSNMCDKIHCEAHDSFVSLLFQAYAVQGQHAIPQPDVSAVDIFPSPHHHSHP